MLNANAEQEKVIQHMNGPLCVIACPGAGKTTTLLRRIQRMEKSGVKGYYILMVTFTNAAASEMQTRYKRMYGKSDVTFCTIHSLCLHILSKENIYTINDLISEGAKRECIAGYLNSIGIKNAWNVSADIAMELSAARNNFIDVYDRKFTPRCCAKDAFQDACRVYDEKKKREHKLDFDDILIVCKEYLEKNPAILRKWQNHYRYILCDEYQDTNYLQRDILYMLSGQASRQKANLCVVGDDDQSIYMFRGAKPEIMLSFQKDFKNCVTVNMGTNYRSVQAVVDFSDKLISFNKKRFKKEFVSYRGKNGEEGHVEYLTFHNKQEEYDYTISRIKELVEEGGHYSQIAILFRTKLQAQFAMTALSEADIPCRTTELVPSVYEEFIYSDILAYAKLSSGEGTMSDLMQILNHPNRFLKEADFKDFCYTQEDILPKSEYLKKNGGWRYNHSRESIMQWMEHLGPGCISMEDEPQKLFDCLIGPDSIHYDVAIEQICKIRHLDLNHYQSIVEYLKGDALKCKTLSEWFRFAERTIAAYRSNKNQSNADSVLLSTAHKSKGLEFKVVFISDVNNGAFPHKNAVTPEEWEEERRLLYVAATRAKDTLYIMNSEEPSPFMKQVYPHRHAIPSCQVKEDTIYAALLTDGRKGAIIVNGSIIDVAIGNQKFQTRFPEAIDKKEIYVLEPLDE